MSNLWIFIIIIGAVISLVQKQQAKQQRNHPANGEPTPQAELERQLREFVFGEKPTSNTPTQSASIPQHNTQPTTATRPQFAAEFAAKRQNIAPKPHNTAKDSTIEVEELGENTTAGRILNDFSMEKAVIYSEILKPKWEEF